MRYCAPLLASLLFCPITLAQTVAIPPAVEASFVHYIRFASELAPLLKEVKDKASAEKAVPNMKPKVAEAFDLGKEIAALKKMPADVMQALSGKYEQSMRTEWGKLYEEIFRLQKVQCYGSLPFAQQLQALCTIFNQ